jgi:dihydropteroate synthase
MNDHLLCGRFTLNVRRPLVMGIVNLTEDSFSGDGLGGDAGRAIEQGWRMVEEGADLLDIGGESSRPGADSVPLEAELARVLPVVEGLRDCGVPLSVDTAKPEVMRAALAAGADMINDIGALMAPEALEAVSASSAAVCLMHMQGRPRTMQADPRYTDVVAEVLAFLAERVGVAERAGIPRTRIVVDPGFGFGKNLDHNLALLRHLPRFSELRTAVLAGISRKSMLGLITGRPVTERLHASVAAALLAAERGAAIVRVHDVTATRDALAVLAAVEGN